MRELSATDFDWTDEPALAIEAGSLIDRHSTFDGSFHSQRDLRVEGVVKGTITCDGTLFVAEGASVSAIVEAAHVTVAGDLTGEIRCRGTLQILPSGRVRALAATAALVIQEGAIYEGQLGMAGVERAAPRPLRSRPSIASVSAEGSPSDRSSSGSGATFIRRLGSPESRWESDLEGTDGSEETKVSPDGEPAR